MVAVAAAMQLLALESSVQTLAVHYYRQAALERGPSEFETYYYVHFELESMADLSSTFDYVSSCVFCSDNFCVSNQHYNMTIIYATPIIWVPMYCRCRSHWLGNEPSTVVRHGSFVRLKIFQGTYPYVKIFLSTVLSARYV